MGHLLLLWSIWALQGASRTASWDGNCRGKKSGLNPPLCLLQGPQIGHLPWPRSCVSWASFRTASLGIVSSRDENILEADK